MNKKYFAAIAVLVSSIFVFSGCYISIGDQKPTAPAQTQKESAKTNDNTPAEPAVIPEAEPMVQLSEQPNIEEFNKYFSEISLGKLAIGKQVGPPDNMPVKTDIFSKTTDLFCVNMTMIKDIPSNVGAGGIYDVAAKKFSASDQKAKFPRALKQGGSSGCEKIDLSVGKYEYKTYINDILVSVIPFEVK